MRPDIIKMVSGKSYRLDGYEGYTLSAVGTGFTALLEGQVQENLELAPIGVEWVALATLTDGVPRTRTVETSFIRITVTSGVAVFHLQKIDRIVRPDIVKMVSGKPYRLDGYEGYVLSAVGAGFTATLEGLVQENLEGAISALEWIALAALTDGTPRARVVEAPIIRVNVTSGVATFHLQKLTRMSEASRTGKFGYGGVEETTGLITYTGFATSILWTDTNRGGTFVRSIQTADGGVIVADGLGRSWRRLGTATPNVVWYGADPTGVVDSRAAFILALGTGANVYAPPGTYIFSANLTIPAGGGISGDSRRKTFLSKQFNGVLMTMLEGSRLENVSLLGNGATFTGAAVSLTGTEGRQSISECLITGSHGPALDIALNAGSQMSCINTTLGRFGGTTGSNLFAVVVEDVLAAGSVPRKFVNIETNGQPSFDFGGSNNTYVTNSFLADLKYSVNSAAVFLTGCRLSNAPALTVRGAANTIMGCDIAPQITVNTGCDNIAITGNSYNLAPVIDNSGNGRNLIDYWTVPYTPVLTSGGTAPVLGTGQLTGTASRTGTTTSVVIFLQLGTTTTLGTGDLRFSLPTFSPNHQTITQVCGTATMNIGAASYTTVVQLPELIQYVRLLRDTTGSVTSTSPGTFANLDYIRIAFSYS